MREHTIRENLLNLDFEEQNKAYHTAKSVYNANENAAYEETLRRRMMRK